MALVMGRETLPMAGMGGWSDWAKKAAMVVTAPVWAPVVGTAYAGRALAQGAQSITKKVVPVAQQTIQAATNTAQQAVQLAQSTGTAVSSLASGLAPGAGGAPMVAPPPPSMLPVILIGGGVAVVLVLALAMKRKRPAA